MEGSVEMTTHVASRPCPCTLGALEAKGALHAHARSKKKSTAIAPPCQGDLSWTCWWPINPTKVRWRGAAGAASELWAHGLSAKRLSFREKKTGIKLVKTGTVKMVGKCSKSSSFHSHSGASTSYERIWLDFATSFRAWLETEYCFKCGARWSAMQARGESQQRFGAGGTVPKVVSTRQ